MSQLLKGRREPSIYGFTRPIAIAPPRFAITSRPTASGDVGQLNRKLLNVEHRQGAVTNTGGKSGGAAADAHCDDGDAGLLVGTSQIGRPLPCIIRSVGAMLLNSCVEHKHGEVGCRRLDVGE